MFKQALDRRAEQGRPIQVGFVGAGRMGTGDERAKAENVVPLGLLTGAKLRCHVPTDKPVTSDMVDVIDNTTLYHLRAIQDAGGAGKFKAAVRDMDGRPEEPRKVAAE